MWSSTGATLIFASGILLRWCISLNPHSGQGKPPMYGDYEAQRHWMEITYNLPVNQWYFNSSDNDLQYWGLDYPPLTAYHSYIVGFVAHHLNASWVELFTSRGMETPEHKLFMRYTVLVADSFVYLPAVLAFAATLSSKSKRMLATVALVFYPGLLLIDYGHFQYNCVSLGLTLLALACLCARRDLLGSIAFVLALNYKQMELYHAMPFFCYLLGSSFRSSENTIFKLVKLSIVVLGTFIACWWPFVQDQSMALQVLHRLFPFSRGLYEDKVANFWCSLSLAVKLRNLLPIEKLIKLCLCSTGVLLFPSSLSLLLRPNTGKFKIALVNSSLVFFLFSFQVHEKSILICALPVCALLPEEPFTCLWFLLISTFSMMPLLIKDGLLLSSVASCLFFFCLVSSFYDQLIYSPAALIQRTLGAREEPLLKSGLVRVLFYLSMLGCVGLTIASLTLKPPPRLPDLFPVLVSTYSCVHFILFLLYFHYMQLTWNEPCEKSPEKHYEQNINKSATQKQHSHSKHSKKKKQ